MKNTYIIDNKQTIKGYSLVDALEKNGLTYSGLKPNWNSTSNGEYYAFINGYFKKIVWVEKKERLAAANR